MNNKVAKFFLLVACIAATTSHAATEVVCPEKINASSASLTLEKPINGFHASIAAKSVHLESAGLYSGPPSLEAELRGGKPVPGAIASWTLVPARSTDAPAPNNLFSETWISCRYAAGLIQLNRQLNMTDLSRCDLKKVKSSQGISLTFTCE